MTVEAKNGQRADTGKPAPAYRRCVLALIASLGAGAAALGMTGPLVTITLKRAGLSSTLIGVNSAMPALALLLLVFGLPRVVRVFGALRAMYAGLALWAAAVLLMAVFTGPNAWLGLRFLLSLGFCVHWVTGEAWINAAATNRTRGRVIGAYVTLSTLGFALGPIAVTAIGFDSRLPFLVIAALIASAAIPLYLMPEIPGPEMPRAAQNLANVARKSPLAMAMGLVGGFCDVSLFALFPIYGLDRGLSVDATIALLVAFLVGTAIMQWPLGWFAERVNSRRLAAICALAVILSSAALPYLLGVRRALIAVMFLWGGAQIGFYTLGLFELGAKFSRNELVGANTIFAFMYGAGAFVGPLAGGAAMDLWGPRGLPIAVAAAAALLLILAAPGLLRGGEAGAAEIGESKT